MRYVNVNILTADDSVDAFGIQIDANQLIQASFAVRFNDATATGTLQIQASNDPCPYGNTAAAFVVQNWDDLPNAQTEITQGSSSTFRLADLSYRWLRAVWRSTSGGTSTVIVDMNALSV